MIKANTPDHDVVIKPTTEQIRGRAVMASAAGKPTECWDIIVNPVPLVWYDFGDAETKRYGQCKMGLNGEWRQPPVGTNPTILSYNPPRRNR